MKTLLRIIFFISLIVLTGCNSVSGSANEAWTFNKILNEEESSFTQFVEIDVQNCCGISEKKSVTCEISKENTASTAASVGVGIDFINGQIELINALGLTFSNGEALEDLQASPGFSNHYVIKKVYTIINGEAVFRNNEEELTYPFRYETYCSQEIISMKENPCSVNCQDTQFTENSPTVGKTLTPTLSVINTPIPTKNSNGQIIQPQSKTVTVYANQGWQNTGISIKTGDLFEIQYLSGKWTSQSSSGVYFGPVTNKAENIESCRPISNWDAALIGKIGENSSPFIVGDFYRKTASESGELVLRMNDCDKWLVDNDGSLQIQITIKH